MSKSLTISQGHSVHEIINGEIQNKNKYHYPY
jgi:hypothetical protein